MADEDGLIFQIHLDNKTAIRSLKEMEEEAVRVGNSGDESMQKWGKRIGVTVDQLESIQKQLEKTGQVNVKDLGEGLVGIFGKAEINAKEFRSFLSKMWNPFIKS